MQQDIEQGAEEDLYPKRVSQPTVSDTFAWSASCPVLFLKDSLGYSSQRHANVCVLEPDVLMFVAGNYIRILNLTKRESFYLRSTGGGAISTLAVHPSRQYFASGESGQNPDVNIFRYPSLRLVKVLRGGSIKVYSAMTFLPSDNQLLATLGGAPDHLLTIWEWQKETPLLRCKSTPQDVHRLSACAIPQGTLTTCGVSHIRFWKMARTFTGFKLQGEMGRFGTLDLCDVDGCAELPDGKVVSSSEWGNLLLWEDGLASAEFVRQNHQPCHKGKINQVVFSDMNLYSLGQDGYVRIWTVSDFMYAEPDVQGGRVLTQPVLEVRVKGKGDLLHMAKASTSDEDQDWFLQERGGRIWHLSLSKSSTARRPRVVVSAHGGPVLACSISPLAHLVATAGKDGQVLIFDCLQRKELCSISFSSPVTSLLWWPAAMDCSGASLVCGFSDGHIKKVVFSAPHDAQGQAAEEALCRIKLSQAFRPHEDRVTSLAFSSTDRYLATGSLDKTLFLFTVDNSDLKPLCWVSVFGEVTHMTWTPKEFPYNGLLVACHNGRVVELTVSGFSFEITEILEAKNLKRREFSFLSIKSELRYKDERERLVKECLDMTGSTEEEEVELKYDEFQDGTEIEQEWKPFIPDTPSPILQVAYASSDGIFWASLGGFDAGYLYRCKLPELSTEISVGDEETSIPTRPLEAVVIPSCSDSSISSLIFDTSGLLAFFGFEDGKVRVVQLKHAYDLSDLSAFWQLSLHDHHHGSITALALAFDQSYLVTSGEDGNIFLLSLAGRLEEVPAVAAALPKMEKPPTLASHDLPADAPSLKEQRKKEILEKKLKDAEEAKQETREILRQLKERLQAAVESNAKLPPCHQLSREEMLINRNIGEEVHKIYQEKIESMKSMCQWSSEKNTIALDKLCQAFKNSESSDLFIVKAFREHIAVRSYRCGPLHPEFLKTLEEINKDISLDKPEDYSVIGDEEIEKTVKPSRSDEAFEVMYNRATTLNIVSMSKNVLMTKLDKIKRAREKRAIRRKEWQNLWKEKPPVNYEDPADCAGIEHAKGNMGDLKLKTDVSSPSVTSLPTYTETFHTILALEQTIREKQNAFNSKLARLRDEKNITLQILCVLTSCLNQDAKEEPLLDILREVTFPDLSLTQDANVLDKFRKELQNRNDRDFSSTAYMEADYRSLRGISASDTGNDWDGHSIKQQLVPRLYFRAQRPPVPEWVQVMLSTKERVEEILLALSTAEESSFESSWEHESFEDSYNFRPSAMEKELEQVTNMQLEHRRSLARNAMCYMMSNFDAKLLALHKEKCQLDIDLKRAEMQYTGLCEQFLICKKGYPTQEELQKTLAKKTRVVADNNQLISETGTQMKTLNAHKDSYNNTLTDLRVRFDETIKLMEDAKLNRILKKIFQARTQRKLVKQPRTEDQEESSDDSSEESFSEASSSDSEGSMEHFNPDICPPDCEQYVYSAVSDLRIRRQEVDDQLRAVQRRLEQCNKNLENAQRRLESLRKAQNQARSDLEEFIRRQLLLLNSLPAAVPIHLSQIKYHQNPSLQEQMEHVLVLNLSLLQQLEKRPQKLLEEVKGAENTRGETVHKFRYLKYGRRVMKNHILTLERECEKVMTKKFGRVVDLKDLENCTFNPRLEHLKSRVYENNAIFKVEMRKLDAEIKKLRYKTIDLTKEESNLFIQKAAMLTDLFDMERRLNARLKTVDCPLQSSKVEQDIQKDLFFLHHLVSSQVKEIAWCNGQIANLRSKRGFHSYQALPALAPITRIENKDKTSVS